MITSLTQYANDQLTLIKNRLQRINHSIAFRKINGCSNEQIADLIQQQQYYTNVIKQMERN